MRPVYYSVPLIALFAGTLWVVKKTAPPNQAADSAPTALAASARVPASHSSATSVSPPSYEAPAETMALANFASLQSASSRPWLASWSRGALLRLAGARLSLGETTAPAAGARFILTYSKLLGVSPADLSPLQERSMEGNAQLLYEQSYRGLPVFNSRLNMVFDGDKNLIYLSSNLYSGPPVESAPGMSLEQASAVAAKGLRQFRISKGDVGEAIPAAVLRSVGTLGFRLIGGNISLVYKFILTIPASPQGDVEILVDDRLGEVILVRSLVVN